MSQGRQTRSPICERLLLALSRSPGGEDYATPHTHRTKVTALSLLSRVFSNFLDKIRDKDVLDFGCGNGLQVVAMARLGARFVFGLDRDERLLKEARNLAKQDGLESKTGFGDALPAPLKGRFEVVVCQNSMEHFLDPVQAMRAMESALSPEGIIFITFGPPWYAPYGSHMHFFTRVPWVNILFRERTVMRVRARFRQDGAIKYQEVESGLNKMSVRRFERIVRESGMKVQWRRYECVKGLFPLGRIPVIKELFVNRVNCILRLPDHGQQPN